MDFNAIQDLPNLFQDWPAYVEFDFTRVEQIKGGCGGTLLVRRRLQEDHAIKHHFYGWDTFDWDDENKKNGNVQHLRDHGIEPDEAEQCFFHDYELCRNERRFDDVYILDGQTDRGRRLRLVFQDGGNGLARVFTGWDLKRNLKRKKKRKK